MEKGVAVRGLCDSCPAQFALQGFLDRRFVDGLLAGTLGFGGEESAGASFLRRDGTVWTTDKDGIIMGLLAAEMTARTGRDPGALYRELASQHGTSYYARTDAESFVSEEHLQQIQREAQELVSRPLCI